MRLGVDVGGTNIKFGVFNDEYDIIFKTKIKNDCSSADNLVSQIGDKCLELMKDYDISSIGIGAPGDVYDGKAVISANLPFKDTPVVDIISKMTGVPVKISNDANCAALCEAVLGAGKGVNNLVMVTLGTGVGGGIIIGKKIYEGSGTAGEIGHMCFEYNGRPCGCGHKGCFEQYVSARALIRDAEKEAVLNETSRLYRLYKENGDALNGELFFDALKDGSKTAARVFDKYTDYLEAGFYGLVKVFRPDVIIIAGGITNEGDTILRPLEEKLKGIVDVKISQFKNDAGIIGAALL